MSEDRVPRSIEGRRYLVRWAGFRESLMRVGMWGRTEDLLLRAAYEAVLGIEDELIDTPLREAATGVNEWAQHYEPWDPGRIFTALAEALKLPPTEEERDAMAQGPEVGG